MVPGSAWQAPVATVNLSWVAPTSGGPVTGYRIRRGTSPWNISRVAEIAATQTRYADRHGEAPGTLLYYEVFAVTGSRPGLRVDAVNVVAGVGGSRSDREQAYCELPPVRPPNQWWENPGGTVAVHGEAKAGLLYSVIDWIEDTAGPWIRGLIERRADTGRGTRAAGASNPICGGLDPGLVRRDPREPDDGVPAALPAGLGVGNGRLVAAQGAGASV